jgi:hypothetical protein
MSADEEARVKAFRIAAAAFGLLPVALLVLLLAAGCVGAPTARPGPDPTGLRAQRALIEESFAGADLRACAAAGSEVHGRESVSAAWWGFDPDDATSSLQAAFDSGARVILVPDMGRPWFTRPLSVRSHCTIVFQEGVELIARKGDFRRFDDVLFTLKNVTDVTFYGYGARLAMRKADYRRAPYERSEYRHALELGGCTGISILGLSVESSGGDAVYLGRGEQTYNKDIVLRDLLLRDNHRQGISVISAEDLLVENVQMSCTEGTLPSAGIDFEPNYPDERFVRCMLRNCTINGNFGPGICLALRNLDRSSPAVDIRVQDSRVFDNLFSLVVFGTGRARGSLDFVSTEVSGVPLVFKGGGVRITGWSAEGGPAARGPGR